jgi:serine/threonine protein kinase
MCKGSTVPADHVDVEVSHQSSPLKESQINEDEPRSVSEVHATVPGNTRSGNKIGQQSRKAWRTTRSFLSAIFSSASREETLSLSAALPEASENTSDKAAGKDGARCDEDPRVTDLSELHCSSSFEALSSQSFTQVKRLSGGINGDVFQYTRSRGERCEKVAVKKLRNSSLQNLQGKETEERSIHLNAKPFFCVNSEDAMTEIGVLSYLSKQPDMPLYLLKMLGVYSESEKPLTWLITEFAEGGELFDAAAGGLGEAQVRDYSWQLVQAVSFLHRHLIGHRDISLENVLLKDGAVRLMDYGMAVRSHSSTGTPLRYFREVGKSFYRAPECYVPERASATVTAPSTSAPGDVVLTHVAPNYLCEVRLPSDMVPGQACTADVWGYEAVPADMFALGLCMFIMSFQCPAWECAKLSNQFFAHVHNSGEKGLESLVTMWGKQAMLSPEGMELISSLLQVDPLKRPSPDSCLNYTWFASMADRPVQLHSDDGDN